MPVTHSPLRYPGGKAQLSGFIEEVFSVNGINDSTYIEPFSGGAGLALSLLFDGKVSRIILNDYDISIYALWHSILYETESLIEKILTTNIDINEWEKQKEIYKKSNSDDLLSLGFSTLFLNRTNRSGIIKAGVIGGKAQLGKYKLDCRFNVNNIVSKIRNISSYVDHIKLYNLDVIDLIDNVITKENESKTFIFFDPPYYNKGKDLYANFFTRKDHEILCSRIKSLKNYSWIVTYDDCNEIREIYQEIPSHTYCLNYSLAVKKKAVELIFFSENMQLNTEYKSLKLS
ncbi:DNA adenine methylase [Pectobacterium polaris]|uniref:DNA adenine methylase n=1 Tax=Pectobacterium polaris TaxID=2042057 RepID=UPI002B250D9A|nr:DNA adenine methylase [Pectobacterium polaris]